MKSMVLGNTGIVTCKNGFGALPIQRIGRAEAVYLLHKALDAGITYFDTARNYSDSEEKLGIAFEGKRDKIILATKTSARTLAALQEHLSTSLRLLKTDYIDVYQLHNPPSVPRPGGEDGVFDYLLEQKRKGVIRHIGITNHRLSVAREAAQSGLYEVLQFPFSYISDRLEEELVELCGKLGVGFVAMKALAGGLLVNSAAAYSFMDKYPNVLPIWGVQRERELDEFISYLKSPPEPDAEMQALIDRDRRELSVEFCRGCGYCSPCPAEIEIHTCARISLLIRRAPSAQFLTPAFQAKMAKIDSCIRCGQCVSRCPYGLDAPSILAKAYDDYKNILAGKAIV